MAWHANVTCGRPTKTDSVKVELLKEDGGVMLLQDWFCQPESPNFLRVKAPRLLRITAKIIQVKLKEMKWTDRNENLSQKSRLAGMSFVDGPHAVLPIREAVTVMTYAYLDQRVPLEDETLGLVLLLGS